MTYVEQVDPCAIEDIGVGEESKIIYNACQTSLGHYSIPFSRLWKNPVSRFYIYKSQWEEDTALLSSVSEIVMHPSYQKIIGLGENALPLILDELKNKPDHWFWALKAITDEDPIKPEEQGRIKRMAEAWLKWGRERGYCK